MRGEWESRKPFCFLGNKVNQVYRFGGHVVARLSEFTFTAFTTHRVLDDLRQQYQSEPYAVAPTQFDERNLGYDARIQTQKILYFQYKRASAHRRYWSYPRFARTSSMLLEPPLAVREGPTMCCLESGMRLI